MQLANKQDWARYHSYEVHQMAELVDSHIRPGPWQKVGYFRKVRHDICFPPQAPRNDPLNGMQDLQGTLCTEPPASCLVSGKC